MRFGFLSQRKSDIEAFSVIVPYQYYLESLLDIEVIDTNKK